MSLASSLWDLWCLVSVAGIWPRWIEPTLLSTTDLKVHLPKASAAFNGLRIVHLSDLHIDNGTSERFLNKVIRKVVEISPDIIVITGDFISHSSLSAPDKLTSFLRRLYASHGIYACLGNHDYSHYLSVNAEGYYDISNKPATIAGGFARLANKVSLTGSATAEACYTPPHKELCSLLEESKIHLLHNKTVQLDIGGDTLNICGLGDLMAGRCRPREAFKGYDSSAPGIILSHNPDSFHRLQQFPGNLILSGHCHGGQVNLPWIRGRLCVMEDPTLFKGRFDLNDKTIYVSRGIGSPLSFRWRARPELVNITLTS